MRRGLILVLFVLASLTPSRAMGVTIVGISASPNPAVVGQKVVHTLRVGVTAPLDIWLSATAFRQPRLGTLPSGRWRLECCPGATAGSYAWHYRSAGGVPPSTYRFGAITRARGTFASTAVVLSTSDVEWVRIT
jgi:hypothetical protein